MRHWVLYLLLAAHSLAAADKYFVYENEHFELITDGPRGRAQEILAHFERVRLFFEKILSLRTPVLKPRIVVFNNEKDYQDHARNKHSAAYYIHLPQRDYIAMGPQMTEVARRTAVHEYLHLLVRYSDIDPPTWMNEGIAELYSNIEQVKKSVRVGTPIPEHIFVIRNAWIPLAEVVAADHESKLYNRREHMGPFYGISWALVHMLALDERYRPNFRALNNAISAGMPTDEAFQAVYKKSVKEVETDLKEYITRSRVNVVSYDVQFEKVEEKVAPRQVGDYEWGVATGDLLSAVDRLDQSMARLEALTNMSAQRPEAWESLALVRWRAKAKGADEAFAKARALGSEHPHLAHWATQFTTDSAMLRESLVRTVERYPGYTEAKLRLAGFYMRDGDFAKVFDLVSTVKKIHPGLVPWYFPLYIQSAWFSGKLAEARGAADQFVRTAAYKIDKVRAAELKELVQTDPQKARPRPVQIAEAREASASQFEEILIPEEKPPPLTYVTGTLVVMECKEPGMLHIQAAEKLVKLAIDDPTKLQMIGAEFGKGEITCGPQKKPVKMGYLADPTRVDGIAGIARSIEFLP